MILFPGCQTGLRSFVAHSLLHPTSPFAKVHLPEHNITSSKQVAQSISFLKITTKPPATHQYTQLFVALIPKSCTDLSDRGSLHTTQYTIPS
jgi:hypothetical protein